MTAKVAPENRKTPGRLILFWIVGALTALPLLLAAAVFIYAERFDPESFRQMLVERINRRISGTVEMDRISFSPGGSLLVEGFRLIAPEPFQHRTVILVPYFELSIWPLGLFQKTLNISNLRLRQAHVISETLPDGRNGIAEAVRATGETDDETSVPAPGAEAPAQVFRYQNDGIAMNLPDLPLDITLGNLEMPGVRIEAYGPGSRLTLGPFDIEAAGDYAGGRVRFFQMISFGDEAGPSRLEYASAGLSIASGLQGKLRARGDTGHLEESVIRILLQTENLQIARQGILLPAGESYLEVRNGTVTGSVDGEFRQGEVLLLKLSAGLPLKPPHREFDVRGSASLDISAAAPVLKASGIAIPDFRGAKFDIPVMEARIQGASIDLKRFDSHLMAQSVVLAKTAVSGLDATLVASELRLEPPSDPHPDGVCAPSGPLSAARLTLSMNTTRQDQKLSLRGTGFEMLLKCVPGSRTVDITGSIEEILLFVPEQAIPVLRTNLALSASVTGHEGTGTLAFDPVSLKLPDNRIEQSGQFRMVAPVSVSARGEVNYRSRHARVEVTDLTISDWLTGKAWGEADYRGSLKTDAKAEINADLTKLVPQLEPLREIPIHLDALRGRVSLESAIKGMLSPLGVDFVVTPLMSLEYSGDNLPQGVGRFSAEGSVSGHVAEKSGLSRLVGQLTAEATDVHFRDNRADRIAAKFLFVPQEQPGVISAAAELSAQKPVVGAVSPEPLPELSVWLKFFADTGAKRISGISMPFTLKEMVNGRVEGSASYREEPSIDLRFLIEPFSLSAFVRKLPEAARRSLARFRLSGTAGLDLRATGNLPGPEFLLNGRMPTRLSGGLDVQKLGADFGEISVKGMGVLARFDHSGVRQGIGLDIRIEDLDLGKPVRRLADTTFRFAGGFETLNHFDINEVELRQPGTGFEFAAEGAGDQLLTSPRADLRGHFALDAEKAAPFFGKGYSAEGKILGNLAIIARNLNQVQLDGAVILKEVSARSGDKMSLKRADGIVLLAAILEKVAGGIRLFPVRNDGVSPEAESLLARRLRSAGETGKPLQVAELSWGAAKVSDFTAWVAVEGPLVKCRSMEASVLDGSLSGDFDFRLHPEVEIHYDGSMTRINSELLMAGGRRGGGDFLINQNMNLKLNARGDIDARINVTRIGKEALYGLLDLVDPQRQNPQVNNVRDKLGYGFVPRLVVLEAENGLLNMFIRLKTRNILANILGPFASIAFGLEHHITRIPLEQILANTRSRRSAM